MTALGAAIRALAAQMPMAEPPAAALAAEAWRLAWRPARLRLLLLAESHMATAAAELACPVRIPAGLDWPLPELPMAGWPLPGAPPPGPPLADGPAPPGAPADASGPGTPVPDAPLPGQPGQAGFLRHVYCPAYGEPGLMQGTACAAAGIATQAGNAGTPQYWRLLAALEGSAPPGRAALPAQGPRLAAKAALLHRLKTRGIWVSDASLAAVAGPGGARADPRAHAAALWQSWLLYQRDALRALDPAHVVVIGRAVAAVLRDALDQAFPGRWQAVPQPMGARGLAATAALHATLAEAARRHAPADRGG